ncbi:helix-turn-helix domain-containing protein [Streptomyces sp. NRRL S-1521]|uniref:helix-turn-helix domain-containing protein n=1 Tax=Streptomyces sp. NRRL S-1521 TaxID=1609100 RepID=UPI001F16D0EE|nr:AraC family transcriptional regulator [Streptomyces sp. NRRL S-1521]
MDGAVKAADGEVTAAGGRRPREQAFWARAPLGPGGDSLDLLTARFDRHRYAPHYHEEFTVGVGVGGCEVIDYRGGRVDAGPGSIVVLAAGEVHTGGPAALGGYAYRAMYPLPSLLAEGTATPPHFREAVVDDPELAAALRAAHTELSGAGGRVDPLEAESRVPWLLTALARRHGAARPLADRVPGADHIARAVRERLADELLAPPSLAELAAPLGLSRYQLLRAFRTSTGLPPYAWLAQYRVTRARAHLDAGLRPADAASLVGFADQAHLTRWFRRVLGVTPAAYRNSVQDAGRRRGADSRHDGTRLVPLLSHGGPVGHPVSHDQGGGRQ